MRINYVGEKKMEMFDQVDSGSRRLSGLRWKEGRGCGKMGFSLIYICSISPRQRVVSRATRCMTMMLLKFTEACRCFIRRLPEFRSRQVRRRSVCYKHLIFVTLTMRGKTSDLISIREISSAVWSLNRSLEPEEHFYSHYWCFTLCSRTRVTPKRWVSCVF